MKQRTIAVTGATTMLGREILQILSERQFPATEVHALESTRLVGGEVSFGEDDLLALRDVETADFSKIDLCFITPKDPKESALAHRAAKAGCLVIACESALHLDPDVPLIVPEVNPDALTWTGNRRIAANPSAAAIALAMALKPLHALAGIQRIVASVFFPVSEESQEAMDELFSQTRAIFVNDALTKEVFTKQIAFNLAPQVGAFMEDGLTRAEWEIGAELKKILDPKIRVAATCVRVPVFIGQAISLTVEFANPITAVEARAALKKAKGVSVIDQQHEDGFVTPVECVGEDLVFVSRIREDISVENGLSLWIVTDNQRKGSALNAVQIGEMLVRKGF